MKKKLSALVTLVLIAAMCLTACGSPQSNTDRTAGTDSTGSAPTPNTLEKAAAIPEMPSVPAVPVQSNTRAVTVQQSIVSTNTSTMLHIPCCPCTASTA